MLPSGRNLPACHRVAVGLIVFVMTLGHIEPLHGATPVLTGRWGDTRVPQQLYFNHTSKKCQALVIITFSTKCPLARRIVAVLNDLQEEYNASDIQLIALFTNGGDDLRSIAEYAIDTGLSFPVFRDDAESPWHEVLKCTVTPEVVVLDTRNGFDDSNVVYRGQINGMWFGGGTAGEKKNYLADALDSFLKNEPPALAETAPSGCPIAKKAFHDLSEFKDVTYHREISRFLQKNCLSCHRDGETGAELFMAFDSYENVAGASEIMLSRIQDRIMPPWHASTNADNGLGGFVHDLRLSDDEINMFRAWVQAECPPGDRSDAPEPIQWRDPDEWEIGEPDLVFEMPEPYIVPKYRLDEYQYYRIKANFPEDRYIQAIELRPGNKSVVHHIGAILGPASHQTISATQAMLELYGLTGDRVKKIGDYVAGDHFNARTYPEGYALKLPAGHDIFFEMHYTPSGREEEADVSRMGIIWAKEPPKHLVETQVFNRKDIRLRPHDGHYEKTTHYMFTTDVIIHALAPHMHYRGKDFTLYKVEDPGTPDERRSLILKIPAFDFNWQRTYEFQNPLKLKAGDALYSVMHYDNSHYNPNNPDPEEFVRFGLKSEQEMHNLRVKFERADFGDIE